MANRGSESPGFSRGGAVNRTSPSLDAVLSAMLLTMLGFGALLFMAACFIAGYAIGLFVVAPIVGWLA